MATVLSQAVRTLPDVFGVAISLLVLLGGIAAVLHRHRRVGRLLWRMMLAGAILGGFLAQLKHADGPCSWIVGWPFAVTRVQNGCADVWFTSGPSVLARVGDIGVAMVAALLMSGFLLLIGRGEPPREMSHTEDSMKARTALTLLTTFALPVALLAQGSAKTSAKPAAQPAESRLVVMPAGDMKWTDLDPLAHRESR
jgi:hypothetical protein